MNRITTNRCRLEICVFLKSDQVRSGAILRRTRPNATCIIAPCVSPEVVLYLKLVFSIR